MVTVSMGRGRIATATVEMSVEPIQTDNTRSGSVRLRRSKRTPGIAEAKKKLSRESECSGGTRGPTNEASMRDQESTGRTTPARPRTPFNRSKQRRLASGAVP